MTNQLHDEDHIFDLGTLIIPITHPKPVNYLVNFPMCLIQHGLKDDEEEEERTDWWNDEEW